MVLIAWYLSVQEEKNGDDSGVGEEGLMSDEVFFLWGGFHCCVCGKEGFLSTPDFPCFVSMLGLGLSGVGI